MLDSLGLYVVTAPIRDISLDRSSVDDYLAVTRYQQELL